MNYETQNRNGLLILAICGQFIAFIVGIIIGRDSLNVGGMLYRDDESILFWLFISLALGILGVPLLLIFINECLSPNNFIYESDILYIFHSSTFYD